MLSKGAEAMDSLRKIVNIAAGILLTIVVLAGVLYILVFQSDDISVIQNEKRHVFGATFMTMNNPYYQLMDTQMRTEIEKNGDVLLTRDASLDQNRQNEEIHELIDSGAEVIFLTCVDWEKASDGIAEAALAGVPVVVVDAPVKDSSQVMCSIVSDNYTAGVLCAEHLLSVRSSANIILLEHMTTGSGTERIQGFMDTIKDHPEFRIAGSGESDGQIESSMPVMEELLREAPEADTVMALNDPSAFGAMAAIDSAGLSDRFLVYSVDGSPEAKALINDNMMTATCAQFPYRVAAESVSVAYRILSGEEVPHEIIIPVELITKENVSTYGTAGWQ